MVLTPLEPGLRWLRREFRRSAAMVYWERRDWLGKCQYAFWLSAKRHTAGLGVTAGEVRLLRRGLARERIIMEHC